MLRHLKDAEASVDKAWEILYGFEASRTGPSPYEIEHNIKNDLIEAVEKLYDKMVGMRQRIASLPSYGVWFVERRGG